MRNIRFRAWDNTNKQWYKDFIVIDVLGNFYRSDEGLYGIDEDIKIMQATGLKDKNGVEIYEGDIVVSQYQCVDDYGNVEEEVYKSRPFEVKYEIDENNQYCGFSFFPSKDMLNGIEVIGNIYENPELLTK